MKCAKMVFLTIAVALLSNGYFLAETILKGSIFLVLMAITGIVGHVHAPIILAQRAAFVNFRLFGNAKFIEISTLSFTFSGDFLSIFFVAFSLVLELATTFSTFSRMPNSFLTLWGRESCVRLY